MSGPLGVELILVGSATLFDLSLVIEPLRLCNRILERPVFSWTIRTANDDPLRIYDRLTLAVETEEPCSFDPGLTLVVGSDSESDRTVWASETWASLSGRFMRGGAIGGIGGGVSVLAEAGLLNGHCITAPWWLLDEIATDFPQLSPTGRRFEIDDRVLTSAGGIAALEMMLAYLGRHVERSVLVQVQDICLMNANAEFQGYQPNVSHDEYMPCLDDALALMHQHVREPLSTQDLSRRLNVSSRKLERLFRQQFNSSPMKYYRELRLKMAKQSLQSTSDSIGVIALNCGFQSASHFTKCYRQHYGVTPRYERTRHVVSLHVETDHKLAGSFQG
ncbi:GlxA family transcriptional regulator [Coralliovum pocilloporae]|uniref:GlxA family transcriptional regulator n=1 Tax=Coralliovum pocilloporae TaxID=3066369 RepID=UPI003306ACA0